MENLVAQEENRYLKGTAVEEVGHLSQKLIAQVGDTRKEVITRMAKVALAFKNLEKIWISSCTCLKAGKY